VPVQIVYLINAIVVRATGYHFTGPIALRRQISLGLPINLILICIYIYNYVSTLLIID